MAEKRENRRNKRYDPFAEDFEEQLQRDIAERVQAKLSKKLGGRDNAVMTRLNDEDLGRLDALVELEMFRSRSEAVAFFVAEGMKAREDLFIAVMPTVDRIRELKEQAKRSLGQDPSMAGEARQDPEERSREEGE